MTLFKKILLILISILLIEVIIIATNSKDNFIEFFKFYNKNLSHTTKVSIENYDPKKPISILIDVSSNTLYVFQTGNLIKTYVIASGTEKTPSPIGTWKIVSKGTWSGGFGGHWMGLNVPWGKYGIHGTSRPDSIGDHASHGCIRMRNSDAADLYKIAKFGTIVTIWGGSFGRFGEYFKSLKPGMRGADVYEIQRLLKNDGYFNGDPDGIYGEGMKYIVHKFEKDNGLPIKDTIDVDFYKKLNVQMVE